MQVIQFQGKIFYPLTCDPECVTDLAAREILTQKEKSVPVFRRAEFVAEELRPGLGSLLNGEPGIANILLLDRREVMNLPKVNQTVTFHPRTGDPMDLRLGNVAFVIFETGVCFLEMDVSLKDQPLEAVMHTAYHLCEPKDKGNRLEYTQVTFDPETKTRSTQRVEFSLKEFFLRATEFLKDCGHFEDRPLSAISAKPLLYAYYLLPERPENYESLTSNLAQNYKPSYQGVEESRGVLQTFRNSAWCVSANGAANLSYLVEDANTNAFFRTTFPKKWEREYLFLFLNVIHQKFALLKYLGSLPNSMDPEGDYEEKREELLRNEALQEACEMLKMRCFFDLPSRVEHVNRVYRFFQTTMMIPQYLASLNRKLEEAANVCRSYTTQMKQIEDKEKLVRAAKAEIKIALLTAAVTCLTFFSSFYDTLFHVFRGELDQISLDAVILTVTFLATISAAIVNMVTKQDEIQDLKQEIHELKRRNELVSQEDLVKSRRKNKNNP